MTADESNKAADGFIQGIVDYVKSQCSDLDAEDDDAKREAIDAMVNDAVDTDVDQATFDLCDAILFAYGEVDLSEPAPDLSLGWFRVRKQLTVNAVTIEVTRRLGDAGVVS